MVARTCCRPVWTLVAAALVAGGWGCRPAAPPASTGAGAGSRQIVALGRLQPATGLRPHGATPGAALRACAPAVAEGEVVPAGAPLAYVESYALRHAQVEAARKKFDIQEQQRASEIALAQAQYQQAVAAQAEVEAKLHQLEAQAGALEAMHETAEIAEADYASLAELQRTDPELVTDQQLRRQRNQADRARREFEVQRRTHEAGLVAAHAAVHAAEKNTEAARLAYELQSSIDATIVAKLELDVAEATEEQSILRAPQAPGGPEQFTILRILLQPGEFVTQFPVFQIADTSSMVCIAEVYEADAKKISVGQSAIIHSSALTDGFQVKLDAQGRATSGGIAGTVERVGSLVSSGSLTQRNPLAPSDRSIIEVRIAIDPEDAAATAEAAAHIGMQVTVYFVDPSADAPAEESKARGAVDAATSASE